jgi:hypothetical protein
MTLDEKIAQAQRHVYRGRLIIERQRVIVARHGMPSAIDLLQSFEQTQQIFEMDLAELVAADARQREGRSGSDSVHSLRWLNSI